MYDVWSYEERREQGDVRGAAQEGTGVSIMDFSRYRGGDIVLGMTIADLPTDAHVFTSGRIQDVGSFQIWAGTNHRHWEYRQISPDASHVWQTWEGNGLQWYEV